MIEKSLCEISNPKQWKTISTDMLKDEGYPVYGANGIIGYYSEYNHEEKTLLITCRGATCGSLNICDPYSYVNGNAMALDNLIEEINIHYLYYYLLNRGLNDAITGTAQPQIVRQSLQKVVIKYPELEVQHQIINRLNQVANLINKRKKQLEKLDELVKSRFAEMFGNGNYPMVKAESVCEFITKGTTPPTGEIYAEFDDNKVPYLKVYNLSFDGSLLFDSEPQYINKEIHNGKLSRSKVYPNDVLMNIVGPPLGKFSLVTAEYPEWNINQAISIFRAKKDVLPRFLLSALMQPTVLKPFLKQAVGVRQLNISLEQCRNLQFPLPPIERQNEFVNFAEQTDKSKLEVQKSLEKLELLKKALMQKYFG